MNLLKFLKIPKVDKRKHDYDSDKYGSSTTVLSCLDTGFDIEKLGEERLAILSSRGTYIHALLESLFKKEIPQTWGELNLNKEHKPNNLRGYELAAYKLYSKYKDKLEVFSMEERILIDTNYGGYAMQPDGIFKDVKTGEYILIDFKTVSGDLQKDNPPKIINLYTKYFSQIASYIYGSQKHYNITISKGIILAMDSNGKLSEYELRKKDLITYLNVFTECLKYYTKYYEWKNKTNKETE